MRIPVVLSIALVLLATGNAFALRCGLDLATEGDLKHEVKLA